MDSAAKPDSEVDLIQASSVTIELIDSSTGRAYKRVLPLEYLENDNGILLTGEDISGKASQIVFLSDVAAKKMRDLTGKGPDKPRDGHAS